MVRRVVTGNDAKGKSYFVRDDEVAEMYVWSSLAGDPLGESGGYAPTTILPSTAPGIEPPPGGSRVVRVQLQPIQEMKEALARGEYAGLDPDGFHRTATVDYIMVVAGNVDLVLDNGRKTLGPGDLVVQRNTNHAWHNLGDDPVDFWGVLVSLEPAKFQ